MDPQLLGEFAWPIRELAKDYPPRWEHANKKAVAEIAGDDRNTPGHIAASRWALPVGTDLSTVIVQQCGHIRLEAGHFSYASTTEDTATTTTATTTTTRTTQWYMNFADPHLFGYGETALLAQDELQIAEHPILCSLAKAMEDGKHGQPGLIRRTIDERTHAPTPVLVQGAPRRCRLDTTGTTITTATTATTTTTTASLYGNAFQVASKEQVQAAVTLIRPPTASNILAMMAAPPRTGLYIRQHIHDLFQTAYCGFRAAVLKSASALHHNATTTTTPTTTIIHTGHWGCGAFGGNKGLVAAIQILAAGTAGVEQVVYWYGFTEQDEAAVEHGMQVAAVLHGKTWEEALGLLEASGYRWGEANENHVSYQPPDNDIFQLAK